MTDRGYVQRMEAAVLKANAAIQKLRQQNNDLLQENTALKCENDRLKVLVSNHELDRSLDSSKSAASQM